LKHVLRFISAELALVAFRGFTAAASLKLSQRDLHLLGCLCFPRFHRRGLIEASGDLGVAVASVQLSAVSPPRPH